MSTPADPIADFVAEVRKQLKAPTIDGGSIIIGAALLFIGAMLWNMSTRGPRTAASHGAGKASLPPQATPAPTPPATGINPRKEA